MQEVAISIPESGHAADVEPTPDAISVDIAEESPGHKGHEGGHAADVEPTRACKSGHAADVAIVGGGWTAIIAARKCQKEGLSVVLLEARDAFGGLWAYSSEAGVPSVFADTITTSSKTVTESVEYPMPADYPEFVPHAQVKQYIDSFVDHFGLRSSIRLNCRVTSVDKIGELDGWRVAYQRAGCAEGESLTAAKLIIATGVHQKASFPDSLMRGPLAGFPREQVIHSSELKTTTPPELAGKRVLVIGGGETSSDLCEGISRIAKAVTWSIPNGVWMISRFTPNFFSISIAPWLGRLFSAKAAFDGYANPMTTVATVTRFFYNGERGARFSPEALKTNATQVAFGFGACGHGVKEWLHPAEYSTSFINKNRDVIEAVHDGIITPRRGLTGGEGQKVTFDDGSSETFDVVVLSTGFSTSLPFLRGTAYAEKLDQRSLYMMCISHEDPSLAFIGFSRPMIGSIPMVAAAQGALIAKTFSGATPLPDKEARAAAIAKVRSHHEAFFSSTSERLTGLISWKYLMHFLYDAIGGKASWRQCAVAVARRPLLFFVAAFSSQGAGILRLAAKGQLDERAWAQHVQKEQKKQKTPPIGSHTHPRVPHMRFPGRPLSPNSSADLPCGLESCESARSAAASNV